MSPDPTRPACADWAQVRTLMPLSAIRAPGPRCDTNSGPPGPPEVAGTRGRPPAPGQPSWTPAQGSFCSGAGRSGGSVMPGHRRHRAVEPALPATTPGPWQGKPPTVAGNCPRTEIAWGVFPSCQPGPTLPAGTGEKAISERRAADGSRVCAGPPSPGCWPQRALLLWDGDTHRPSAMPGHPGRTS